MNSSILPKSFFCVSVGLLIFSCNGKRATEKIAEINLKRGEIISCSPPGNEFGIVDFESSCPELLKKDFATGVALLHSFEYDEAEKVFAKIIDREPDFAMAWWGVAMANYHSLWAPPLPSEMEKGEKAISIAQTLKKTKIEEGFIDALSLFYKNYTGADHAVRSMNYRNAMQKLYEQYPRNKEVAIFYALTLTATANPSDKTFVNQKKAGKILESLYPGNPEHPGIVHYIIHTYDYPGLAELALPAARKYASVAPSSAHAQHMPSHIFTRLGLWDESISSNIVSAASAKCYAQASGNNGHWDEELHSIDYLVYAYLQKGQNSRAKEQCNYIDTIQTVWPMNFKVMYAFAAIPCRYLLENKMWKDAAALKSHDNAQWEKYPWQNSIRHFTKLLGFANTGKLAKAQTELKALENNYNTLIRQQDYYKANQVLIQVKSGLAYIRLVQNDTPHAIMVMEEAALLEDKTEKSPVTPSEVLPAKELLGDIFMKMKKYGQALKAYEESLATHPNRFNGLYGAGTAAEKMNDVKKAQSYYRQLLANAANSTRIEIEEAKFFLKNH